MTNAVARMIRHADLNPGDLAVVHVLDPLIPGAAPAAARSTTLTQDALPAELARLLGGSTMVQVTPARPIGAYEARLEREQLSGWLAEAAESAALEGGSGVIVGYDPLNPERRMAVADVAISKEAVFAAGGTLFRWDEVARASACRGSDTAHYLLVDGRSVFIHADVDWRNRLG